MLLHTPLHKYHVEHGAQMVEFAGWEMPIRYTSIADEHKQVRTSGGLFDVSHMGRVKISGRHARRLLERLCSRKISDMQAGQCRYSLCCNEQGGVLDDVIVYRFDDDEFLVVVNGANREKMLAHFEKVRSSEDLVAKIDDQTTKTAMVAFQGPKVIPFISRFSSEIPTLKRYRFTVKNLVIAKLTVSRTGYTGEDGVEVILPASMVDMAMKLLLKDVDAKAPDALVKPCGLGARDTLRLEAGMPLYGHELGEDINALACGVDFAISLDKDEGERGIPFIGIESLKRTRDAGGPAEKLVGIVCDGRRTPRQGMPIKLDEQIIGRITSGCLSPTLDQPIAMGFVRAEFAAPGTALGVDAGRAVLEGKVVALPFYKAPKA
ncbi:MAG: glycine cleavage system aminomethyltransferase GcvT [Phycisphaeraceae bacterium]|nr:glycine cleavage system aminomethyltransferase GcvT [Phycisphaeraceae bacterium]